MAFPEERFSNLEQDGRLLADQEHTGTISVGMHYRRAAGVETWGDCQIAPPCGDPNGAPDSNASSRHCGSKKCIDV